ncbi:MAG TPA: hypothetical protein VEM76_01830 [Anaeromyxobacteraceae bacterium]|nr:hypothetical protein [Anaeromyxobacteraceae bacterium]
MTKLPVAAATCLLLSLSACAGIQSVKVAQLPRDAAAPPALSEGRPAKDDVASRAYEVPDKSAFFQQWSGGSVGLGVALGPIGVAMNIANIDRTTRKMGEAGAVSGLYQIDAREEARAAIEALTPPRAKGGIAAPVTVQPYVTYLIADEGVGLETLVTLRVESAVGGERKLLGSYTYYLDGALPLESFKKALAAPLLVARREAMRRAYAELYREVLVDVSGKAPAKQDIARVKSRATGVIPLGGNISRNAAGHLVVRAISEGWHPTYTAVVFAADAQYTFTDGPVARQQKPAQDASAEASASEM